MNKNPMFEYDVVVIGGGIIGASIAAKLLKQNQSVVLLEQNTCGGTGSSSYSGGLFRLFDKNEDICKLAKLSVSLLNTDIWKDYFKPAMKQQGLIYRTSLDNENYVDSIINKFSSQHYPIYKIDRTSLSEIVKSDQLPKDKVNIYEPTAQVGNVRLACSMLANYLRSNDAIFEHTEVEEIIESTSGISVKCKDGPTIKSKIIVSSKGAWLSKDLHKRGMKVKSIPLGRVKTNFSKNVALIDDEESAYMIPMNQEIVLVGGSIRASSDKIKDLNFFLSDNRDSVSENFKSLTTEDAEVLDIIKGFDSYEADSLPSFGFTKNSNIYLAAGMAGIGYKLGPAIAEISTAKIINRLNSKPDDSAWECFSPNRLIPTKKVVS